MYSGESPLIIGGVGGSGTRVVCDIARDAGFFMGSNLNNALDSLDFQPFFDNCIRQLVENKDTKYKYMKKTFFDCLSKHLKSNRAGASWGIKIPRFILILPFLHSLFPKMKFIHVIRDGRDMAFSWNQIQTKLYGDITCQDEPKDTPLYNLEYWCRINQMALDYGFSKLKKNYLLVRFEDLVRDPQVQVKNIFAFLESARDSSKAQSKIRKPSSIGRWKQNSEILAGMSKYEISVLTRFGYY